MAGPTNIMILEVILIILLAIIAYSAIVTRRSRLASALISTSSSNAISHDDQLDSLLEIAGRYYQERNYLAAEKAYLKVLKIDHKNSLAYSRLGFIYSNLGNTEDAIECFQIVAQMYPNAASYHNLAMMYFKNRDYTASAEALEKSVHIEPNVNRFITLARIYRILHKFHKQIDCLNEALKLEPKNVDILQLQAEAYMHEKDEAAAKKVFRTILKIDPDNQRARAALKPPKPVRKVRQ
jgi:Tfp pilus assembly protein PilF